MDRNVLEARLRAQCELAIQAALKAVDGAPDGQWIAGSEWQVREVFQRLMGDCYGAMIQSRIDALPSAKQAAFSPGGPGGGDVAQQGVA